MLHEDWTFISSVYYGVTAMSTGGLQTPNGRSAFSMMFTGIYVLIGVPLYVVFYNSIASTQTSTPTSQTGTVVVWVSSQTLSYKKLPTDERRKS